MSHAASPDVAIRADAVRTCIAALFGTLLCVARLRDAQPGSLAEAYGLVGTALPQVVALIERRRLAEARRQTDALRVRLRDHVGLAEGTVGDASARLIALDRLLDVIANYSTAVSALAALHGGIVQSPRAFRYHRDWRGAVENRLRSLLAIPLAGAFGIAAGWSDWSLLLLILAPYTVLLALTRNPAAGAVAFIKGTIVAVPLAFVCAFGLLPGVQGFPPLVAILATFWMAGLYATTIPRHAPAGLTYLVAFKTLVGVVNPMVFSVPAFLNQAFGWIAAVLVTLLVFRVILPPDPHRQARRIEAALRRDVLAAVRSGFRAERSVWEHLQHHSLVRIALGLKADPGAATPMLADGIAGLQLGRAALRVRDAAGRPNASQALREATLAALAGAARPSPQAAHTLTRAAADIAAQPVDEPPERAVAQRIVAGLADMASLVGAQADWLAGRLRYRSR
nr:FUSC family protein [Methylobacterium sp. GC_Met_2]